MSVQQTIVPYYMYFGEFNTCISTKAENKNFSRFFCSKNIFLLFSSFCSLQVTWENIYNFCSLFFVLFFIREHFLWEHFYENIFYENISWEQKKITKNWKCSPENKIILCGIRTFFAIVLFFCQFFKGFC